MRDSIGCGAMRILVANPNATGPRLDVPRYNSHASPASPPSGRLAWITRQALSSGPRWTAGSAPPGAIGCVLGPVVVRLGDGGDNVLDLAGQGEAGAGREVERRALAGAPVRVLVLDRRNHHLFQPLLYQVATAGLSPAEIASPIRRILRRQTNATVLLAEATAVLPEKRRVILSDGEVAYEGPFPINRVLH